MPGPISPPGLLVAYSLGETDHLIGSRACAGRRKSTMPRRVIQALVVLTLLISAASPAAAAAVGTVSTPLQRCAATIPG